jgi:hypothetical protein
MRFVSYCVYDDSALDNSYLETLLAVLSDVVDSQIYNCTPDHIEHSYHKAGNHHISICDAGIPHKPCLFFETSVLQIGVSGRSTRI